MKINKKHLLVLSVMSGISGCASLSDSPYYRVWHDRAYEISASPAVMQQAMATTSIPEAEPVESEYPAPVAQTVGYAEPSYNGGVDSDAYTVEGDPFRSYAQPRQAAPRLEEQPMRRDYSNMR